MLNIKKYSDVLLFILLLMTSLWHFSLNAEPTLQGQLANGATKSFANFGTSVAVTESFILVGTPGKKKRSGGGVYFFTKSIHLDYDELPKPYLRYSKSN